MDETLLSCPPIVRERRCDQHTLAEALQSYRLAQPKEIPLCSFDTVSLLDMIALDPRHFLGPMSYIGAMISELRLVRQLYDRIAPPVFEFDKKVSFLKSVELLKETAVLLGMRTTVTVIDSEFKTAVELLAYTGALSSSEIGVLISYAEKVEVVFKSEANQRIFLALAPGHAAFMPTDQTLFGDQVDDAFPNAVMEIADAGRCRAAGIWTASVMHLMRALEVPLNALAAHVGVDVGQNWNNALNQIESKLREQTRASAGIDGEQWAAEAAAHLRAIKNAWRNHAQHGVARYNEEEAVAIWNNAQALMQTLAKRLGDEAT